MGKGSKRRPETGTQYADGWDLIWSKKTKLEIYKNDIVTHFDKLEIMMNKQMHLTNPKKVYKHMSKVEYKWHFIEEDDREFYQGCLFALENGLKWTNE
jgi:uncharacterized membrane-anchored protein YhcB (DUF1043 family)|tara:strand:- start:453 stop:746 length:294 start_codon:yes stop_codon:yes gene_type:complete